LGPRLRHHTQQLARSRPDRAPPGGKKLLGQRPGTSPCCSEIAANPHNLSPGNLYQNDYARKPPNVVAGTPNSSGSLHDASFPPPPCPLPSTPCSRSNERNQTSFARSLFRKFLRSTGLPNQHSHSSREHGAAGDGNDRAA
jgi:hypothetical protein